MHCVCSDSQRSIWMYQDFCVSLDPLIKFPIRPWSFINANFMGHNKARIRFARYDHVPKVAIVLLDVTLSSPNGKTLLLPHLSAYPNFFQPRKGGSHLLKQLPKTHQHHSLPTLLIDCPRITWHVESWNPDSSCRPRDPNTLLQHHVRNLACILPCANSLISH